MQIAVTNFVKSNENGLCLIDMPTGTGKTYQTKELIKKIIKGEELQDIELVIYLTPLRKNIDDIYNELRKDFEDDLEFFDNNVLRIYSNYECVLDNLLNLENQIPVALKEKKASNNLKTKFLFIKSLKAMLVFQKNF